MSSSEELRRLSEASKARRDARSALRKQASDTCEEIAGALRVGDSVDLTISVMDPDGDLFLYDVTFTVIEVRWAQRPKDDDPEDPSYWSRPAKILLRTTGDSSVMLNDPRVNQTIDEELYVPSSVPVVRSTVVEFGKQVDWAWVNSAKQWIWAAKDELLVQFALNELDELMKEFVESLTADANELRQAVDKLS